MKKKATSTFTFISLICFAILASLKQCLKNQEVGSSGPNLKFFGNYHNCDEARNALSHTLKRIGSSELKFEPWDAPNFVKR